jgi:hypothetical protein
MLLAADKDLGGGTVSAEGMLETTAGNIEISTWNTEIELDGDVTAENDLKLNNNTVVADHTKLTAGSNLQLGADKTLTGQGDLALEATEGAITSQAGDLDGKVDIRMAADDKTLSLTQWERLSLTSGFVVKDADSGDGDTSPKDTHLIAKVTGHGFDYREANRWKSVQAEALGNVKLSTSPLLGNPNRDIVIGTRNWDDPSDDSGPGIVCSIEGGVSIISDAGGIYDADSYDYGTATGTALDNVTIMGTSNQAEGVGVGFPDAPAQKAAIVIQSERDLEIGAGTTLIADGTYSPINSTKGTGSVDDRGAVGFQTVGDEAGDPIDIAIYLASVSGDVTVNSKITLPPPTDDTQVATVAINAFDTVKFDFEDGVESSGNFESPENFHAATRLEVASRSTENLDDAAARGTLPYANIVRSNLAPDWFAGEKYVLRGRPKLKALKSVAPVPLAPPILFEPEDSEEVETDTVDPSVMDDITLAFGEEFFQLPITGAAPDMVAIDEKITEEPRLRIQNYWCILDPVKTPSSGQVIPILNGQMETLEEPTRENIAQFDRALRSNRAVGQWLDAFVGFVAESKNIFDHDADELIGTIQNRFLRRYEATSKVQQYMNRYIRIMTQPRLVAESRG